MNNAEINEDAFSDELWGVLKRGMKMRERKWGIRLVGISDVGVGAAVRTWD